MPVEFKRNATTGLFTSLRYCLILETSLMKLSAEQGASIGSYYKGLVNALVHDFIVLRDRLEQMEAERDRPEFASLSEEGVWWVGLSAEAVGIGIFAATTFGFLRKILALDDLNISVPELIEAGVFTSRDVIDWVLAFIFVGVGLCCRAFEAYRKAITRRILVKEIDRARKHLTSVWSCLQMLGWPEASGHVV